METAKVDIRKLQLLNDRINQCIDALHQVRLSVHALQQGYQTQQPFGFFNQGLGQGFGQQGFGQQGFGQGFGQSVNPFQQQQQWNPPYQQSPFLQQHPLLQQMLQQQNPFQGQHPLLQQMLQQQNPFQGQNPAMTGQTGNFGVQGTPGLLHTGTFGNVGADQELYNRPLLSDPFLAVRIANTFPYAHSPVPVTSF